MNYIKQLNAFTKKMAGDEKINPNHLALYHALFQQWNYQRFAPVFAIRRETTLLLSKIGSAKTYYKCLKELQAGGYIKYYPATGKYARAKISMIVLQENETEKQPAIFCNNGHEDLGLSLAWEENLEELPGLKEEAPAITDTCSNMDTHSATGVEQDCTNSKVNNIPPIGSIYTTLQVDNILPGDSNNDPICEAVLPHSLIKQKKIKDFKSECVNVFKRGHSHTDNQSFFLNQEKIQQHTPAPVEHYYPTLEEVITFFKMHLFSELEGKKFHYHYDKEGWKLAGAKPISNWKRVAQKWMSRVNNLPENIRMSLSYFNPALYTDEHRNFSKPL
ncbi:hypothetical protein [Chitinophaga defluvii]|uniref:Transcriptional regulator n=1 Tax=Chitinophaga defluvii TaxID=3163343 RepID=A0ABV2TB09_9BACT